MLLEVSLFFSTFVLEDVALASALALISQEKITFAKAFLICSFGIGVGILRSTSSEDLYPMFLLLGKKLNHHS